MPLKLKKTKFLGNTVTYKNIVDISKKLKVTREQAKEIRNVKKDEELNKYLIENNGSFGKQDLTKKPIILRKFGINNIKQVPATKLMDDAPIHFNNNRVEINSTGIPLDIDLSLSVNVNITVEIISGDNLVNTEKRVMKFSTKAKANELQNYIEYKAAEYVAGWAELVSINEVRIFSTYTDQEFYLDMENNRMLKFDPINIFNQWINIDENNNNNCVPTFLKNKLRKISKKNIDKLGNIDGVSIKELIEFCAKYCIEIYVYGYDGLLIKSNIPGKRNKSYPILNVMYHNSHLYGINNSYLQKRIHDNIKIELINNCNEKINEFLLKNIEPSDIKCTDEKIYSFVVDGIKYLENNEYNKCKEILNKLGLNDKIYDEIKITSLFNIIEKLYVNDYIDCFWPESKNFIKGGFRYDTGLEITDDTKTIDKSKCYSCALRNLNYIIFLDYRTSIITKNPKTIIPHYLYIAQPTNSTILIPNTNVYSGEHLIYCKKEGIPFELLEEITAHKLDYNPYVKMIDDLYNNFDNKVIKDLFNYAFGKFECDAEVKMINNCVGIFDKQESKSRNGLKMKINDNFTLIYNKKEQVSNIYNKKALSIQIKDQARVIIYEKMKDLKLDDSNIIRIDTDSITYNGELPKDLNNTYLGWKQSKYELKIEEDKFGIEQEKETLGGKNFKRFDNEIVDNINVTFKINSKFDRNIISLDTAGKGKTTEILEKIIPTLKSYVVITPSHKTLEEYKIKNVNNCIAQKYKYTYTLPTEKVIIIDEFGMCDRSIHDLIYKCSLLGKQIIAFGDFNQLPAVNLEKHLNGVSLSSKQYIDYLFPGKKLLKKNWRNNFTDEYYAKLYNEDPNINLLKEIKLHSTKNYKDAEIIICYRNKTVDKYNELKLQDLELDNDSIGLNVICIKNDPLLHKKDIYHGFEFKIVESNEINIKLSNGSTITRQQFEYSFKPSYARTIYNVQGKTINSYYWAEEDNCFVNGKLAYTVISRLKQELNQEVVIQKKKEIIELDDKIILNII